MAINASWAKQGAVAFSVVKVIEERKWRKNLICNVTALCVLCCRRNESKIHSLFFTNSLAVERRAALKTRRFALSVPVNLASSE